MPETKPATLFARWTSANPQSALNILGRTINNNFNGVSTGRRGVQVRPYKLTVPNAPIRSMYVCRFLGSTEKLMLFVHDPDGPARTADLGAPEWAFCSLGPTTSGTVSATFDSLAQNTLVGTNTGQWVSRGMAVSVEGFAFFVPGTEGALGDWEIKVGSVLVKGGTNSGLPRGILVEFNYLPVRTVAADSEFINSFARSIFPAQALENGEIEFISPTAAMLHGGGLLETPSMDSLADEWLDDYSAFVYVNLFRKEGLL